MALIGLHGKSLTVPALQRMEITAELNTANLEDVEEIASRLEPFLAGK